MSRKLFFIMAIGIILGFAFMSCKDERPNPEDIFFPDTVSYTRHVQPLFDATCAFPQCHGDDTYEKRGFSLTNYNDFMFSLNMVILRGDPESSILIQRVEGRSGLPRMPLDLPPLNKNQTDGLRRWILQGARNN